MTNEEYIEKSTEIWYKLIKDNSNLCESDLNSIKEVINNTISLALEWKDSLIPEWKKSEPDPGKIYILKFKSGSIVETDDYRPEGRCFNYEDGDYYPPVKLDSADLEGWIYRDELDIIK